MPFIQQEDQNENQNNGQLTTGGGTGAAGTGAVSTPMNPQSKQGSGRFTNINKYITANQQGSQNLANRLGTGIQGQLDSSNREVNTQNDKVAGQIGSGRETLGKADQDTQALKSIGEQFKPGFAASQIYDPNSRGNFTQGMQAAQNFKNNTAFGNLNNFKQFQQGNAIDQDAIGNDVSQQGNLASNFQNQFTNRQQQVGNEQGRQQLLGEFIGGGNSAVRPAYSMGQRKLDNLVLQQNTGNLKSLMDKVASNKSTVDQALQNVNLNETNLGQLSADEQAKIQGINTQAKSNQDLYQQAFGQDKLDQINQDRQKNYQGAVDQLYSGNIAAADYDKMGLGALGENTATYNLIDEIRNANRGNEFLSRKADVLDTNQIGTQSDVDTDAALADILGTAGGRKFTQAGDLDTAYSVNQADGGSALVKAIKDRQQQEIADAQNTRLAHEGKDSYWDWGSKKEKRQTSTGTVSDLLGGGFTSYGDRGDVTQGAAQDAARYLSPLLGNSGGQIVDAGANLVNNLSNAAMGNQSGGAADAAYSNSIRGLFGQLQDYMTQRGYGKGINKV